MTRSDERGVALISVLVVILILSLLGGLLLYLSGQEAGISRIRYRGAQSLAIAEGGAWAGRAALMAVVNADPIDLTRVDQAVQPGILLDWFAEGNATAQKPFAFLRYLIVDGQRLNVDESVNGAAVDWVAFHVNWGLPFPHLKLEYLDSGRGEPDVNDLLARATENPLPQTSGSTGPQAIYRAVVILRKEARQDSSCAGGGSCYIHKLGEEYAINLRYEVASEGYVDPAFRRRVKLYGGDERVRFQVLLGRESFARNALMTHVHLTPNCGDIWFTSRTSFDGPVHTNSGVGANGEDVRDGCTNVSRDDLGFRFAFFPKFGRADPDSGEACGPYDRVSNPNGIQPTELSSVSEYAWFNNRGNPRRLPENEHVNRQTGERIDAPVQPDCTPGNLDDDRDNAAATFTRGAEPKVLPGNPYNHKGISIGRENPEDQTPVTSREIREKIPELRDNGQPVPEGIYFPVEDANGNCISDGSDRLVGGIYVQGNLDSLIFRTEGNLGVYEFRQGSRTVTVKVDRTNNTTTVEDTRWPGRENGACGPGSTEAGPRTVTFRGVPNGVIYVEGNIGRANSSVGLQGQLGREEQVTVVASGTIYIANHLTYQEPPNLYDDNHNPRNLLGVYAPRGDIRISRNAPPDLQLHGVFMAGQPGVRDGIRSSVNVEDYDTISCRGAVHLIGGIIGEYYGAFGTFDPRTGACRSGYGRDFRYDRRMQRGFAPPFFPTTGRITVRSEGVAGHRPRWQELSPP